MWRRGQRTAPFRWFCTSEAVILPSGPEPPSVARSTPSSFASFLAYGVAMTRPSARGAGADEAGGGGGGAEGAEGAGAAEVDAATGSGLASTLGASACFTWARAWTQQPPVLGCKAQGPDPLWACRYCSAETRMVWDSMFVTSLYVARWLASPSWGAGPRFRVSRQHISLAAHMDCLRHQATLNGRQQNWCLVRSCVEFQHDCQMGRVPLQAERKAHWRRWRTMWSLLLSPWQPRFQPLFRRQRQLVTRRSRSRPRQRQ